jgi:S1-C subfamily serine protease
VERYVHKGDRLYVEGRIEYSQTEDEQGNARYWTDIIVREMVMLGQGAGGTGPGGGPQVNTRGEVIGMKTAIISGSQGIGFAININDIKVVTAQLIDHGFVNRGFLGITPLNLSRSLAQQIGAPVTEGVLIVQVAPNSAADEGGLQEEDVIVAMNDQPINNTGQLSQFLLEHPAGETVSVRFFRADQEQTTEVVLGERPGGP